MVRKPSSAQTQHRIRLRRLPDTRKFGIVPWSAYEVQAFTSQSGPDDPVVTQSPSGVIGEITGSRHPADLSPYSYAADMGWDGDVGLWRGDLSRENPWPGELWEPGPPPGSSPRNADWIARRADRAVRQEAGSLVGALLLLRGVLARGGQESWAMEARALVRERVGMPLPTNVRTGVTESGTGGTEVT